MTGEGAIDFLAVLYITSTNMDRNIRNVGALT